MFYHFENKKGWMNDPNGLIWYKGEYHAFFQHYPFAPRWGQMHWGHATSKDLIHWTEHDIALFPDKDYENDGGCFSGSAIEKDGRLYLFYTSVSHEHGQTQSVAWSDDGFNFVKYEGNPIIKNSPLNTNKDFRDPKVFKYEDEYRMVVGAGAYNIAKILLFKSKDLLNWEYVGEILSDGRFGGVAECPDLFMLEDKWVLMFSSVKALPHRVCFAVGEFDGDKFIDTEKYDTRTDGNTITEQLEKNIEDIQNGNIITDAEGNALSWASAGGLGFRGSKKSTPYAAQMAAETATKAALIHGLKTVDVFVKGPGSGREAAIRALQACGLEVTSIRDVTPVPHNGCRPPKRRRV